MKGEYRANQENMVRYLEEIKKCVKRLKVFEIYQIPREENKLADLIVRAASDPKVISAIKSAIANIGCVRNM